MTSRNATAVGRDLGIGRDDVDPARGEQVRGSDLARGQPRAIHEAGARTGPRGMYALPPRTA